MTEQDKFPSEDNNDYFFDELIENDNCLCSVLLEKSKSDEKDKNADKVDNYLKKSQPLSIAVNSETLPHLVATIKDFFESGTHDNTVIGLTGHYGCGKTSFCRFLESELTATEPVTHNSQNNTNQSEYVFFFYDLWMHHHDNIKKSIVTELSAFLLSKGILEDRDFNNDKADKLLEWMSRHYVGSKKNLSKISLFKLMTIPFVISIIVLALGSLFEFFNFWNDFVEWGDFYIGAIGVFIFKSLLWSFLIIILIFYLVKPCFLKVINYCSTRLNLKNVFIKRHLDKLLSYAHVEYSENTCNDDLSVRDFQNWLLAIYRNLKPHSKIILVLDNLDRLPETMIKDFFASIHDLFYILNSQKLDKGEKITSRIHVIIPFEYDSVYKIFEKNPKNDTLSKGIVKRNIDNNAKEHLKNADVFSLSDDKFEKLSKQQQKSDKENSLGQQLSQENGSDAENIDLSSSYNYTEDFLDKTFSIIFYLPHFNPHNYRVWFNSKLDLIVKQLFENITKEYLKKHYVKSFDFGFQNLKTDIERFEKDINEVKINTYQYCWNIFIKGEDYNSLSLRKMLSYLREIHLLLRINYRNLFFDNCPSVAKILLYVAYYSKNISTFRRYSLAVALNFIGNAWKQQEYGIISKYSRASYPQSKSAHDEENDFLNYVQMIYYQASLSSISLDDLYVPIIVDSIVNGNTVLVESKLSGEYFQNHSAEVISQLLNQLPKLEQFLNIFETLFDKRFVFGFDKEHGAFSLNHEEQTVVNINDSYSQDSMMSENDKKQLTDIWSNVFCKLLERLCQNIEAGIDRPVEFYSFLVKIYFKSFKEDPTYLFLLVSYIKVYIAHAFSSIIEKHAVSSIIAHLIELDRLALDASNNSLSISDDVLKPDNNTTVIEKEFIEYLQYKTGSGTFTISSSNNKTDSFDKNAENLENSEQNSEHNVEKNENPKNLTCIILQPYSKINKLICILHQESSLLENFNKINCQVMFQCDYDKGSSSGLAVNWNLPVSREIRNFISNHVFYSEYKDIDLKYDFIETFKNSVPLYKNWKELNAEEQYKINKYFYKYALLCTTYKCEEQLSYEDLVSTIDCTHQNLYLAQREQPDTQQIYHSIIFEKLSPFIRFIITKFPVEYLEIKDTDIKKLRKIARSEANRNGENFIYDGDNIIDNSRDWVFTELEACRIALVMIKNYIFNTNSHSFYSTNNYIDVEFFLNAFMSDDSNLVKDCLEYNVTP